MMFSKFLITFGLTVNSGNETYVENIILCVKCLWKNYEILHKGLPNEKYEKVHLEEVKFNTFLIDYKLIVNSEETDKNAKIIVLWVNIMIL